MFSCAQACKLRDLGQTETVCEEMCQTKGDAWTGNYQGCHETVNGFRFQLCKFCRVRYDSPMKCAQWSDIDNRVLECKSGCHYYPNKTAATTETTTFESTTEPLPPKNTTTSIL